MFDRSGRSLVLTDVRRSVFDYADEMFTLGREMLGTLSGLPGNRSGRFHAGIPTFLPKVITHRLLEPVLQMPQSIQLICHEAEFNELVSDLVRHKFDAILIDTPLYPHSVYGLIAIPSVNATSHSAPRYNLPKSIAVVFLNRSTAVLCYFRPWRLTCDVRSTVGSTTNQ